MPGVLFSQALNNSSLNGKYYFVHLLVDVAESGVTQNAHNASGSIQFDGNGNFVLDGNIGSGDGVPLPGVFGNGTYSVAANGFVTLDNLPAPLLDINARLGAGAEIVLGSSTEADGTYDLFVALKAPTSMVTNAVLSGDYTGGLLSFPNGSDVQLTSALMAFSANAVGGFPTMAAIGHAFDFDDENFEEQPANVTYSINGDATGTVNFGSGGTLLWGNYEIFVSANGNYLLGSSTEAGGRQIFLAIRNLSDAASTADWNGDYWIAEIEISPSGFRSATGALRANGLGTVSLAQRTNSNRFPFDFSGLNFYVVDPESRGFFGTFVDDFADNFAIGAPVAGEAGAFVGARVLAAQDVSETHGIFFGVRLPSLSGGGVFLNPLGVINSASFAMPTFPIAPGTLVSLFGTGLAPPGTDAKAQTLPLPNSLAGVSVTVNGLPAPIFSVLPGQINIQVPFGVTGPTATVIVNNNGTLSNPVEVTLAPTSPGVFSATSNGIGAGVITHLDSTLVTPENPAAPNEFVTIYVSGLGAVNPPIADGAAGPTMEPLPRATDPGIQVFFGADAVPAAEIQYAGIVPTLAGLYQINVRIPNDPSVVGSAVPVLLQTSNACSDFVDIAIGL